MRHMATSSVDAECRHVCVCVCTWALWAPCSNVAGWWWSTAAILLVVKMCFRTTTNAQQVIDPHFIVLYRRGCAVMQRLCLCSDCGLGLVALPHNPGGVVLWKSGVYTFSRNGARKHYTQRNTRHGDPPRVDPTHSPSVNSLLSSSFVAAALQYVARLKRLRECQAQLHGHVPSIACFYACQACVLWRYFPWWWWCRATREESSCQEHSRESTRIFTSWVITSDSTSPVFVWLRGAHMPFHQRRASIVTVWVCMGVILSRNLPPSATAAWMFGLAGVLVGRAALVAACHHAWNAQNPAFLLFGIGWLAAWQICRMWRPFFCCLKT